MDNNKENAPEQVKTILNLGYEEFVENLGKLAEDPKILAALSAGQKDGRFNDERIKFTRTSIPVRKLHPTQNEIDIDKSLMYPLIHKYPEMTETILKGEDIVIMSPIITLNGKYIIDGHHRWSQIFAINRNATVAVLNMQIDEEPINVLKAVQMAIAVTLKDVPSEKVNGHNMLDIDRETIIEFVEKHMAPDVVTLLHDYKKISEPTRDEAAEYIWNNVKYMSKTSRPIKDAPERGVMPQTDKADQKGWMDLLKNGQINFKEPVAPVVHESRIRMFENFDSESLGNIRKLKKYSDFSTGE